MKYEAKISTKIILGINAVFGLTAGIWFLTSPQINVIASLAVILYGLIFLWAIINVSIHPIYEVNDTKLKILKQFKKNIILDLSAIEKIDSVNNYLALYFKEKTYIVTSAQIGSTKFSELSNIIKKSYNKSLQPDP